MPFPGFGASKSSSKQQATASASSFDVSQSVSESGGFSNAGSLSDSFSQSLSANQTSAVNTAGSTSAASSQQQQTIAFEDVFARLFGGAEGAAGGLDTSLLTGAANQLFSGGLDFLSSLSGGADSEFLQNRLSGDNAVLGDQITGLGEDIGQFFNQQILPGIQSEAIAGGGLGGSRQGIAEGLAAQASGREFQRGATALRAGDIASRDNAAIALGQNRVAGAQAGLGGLGGLAGIADFGFGAELAPFERLSSLLGSQQVLSTGTSQSVGQSSSAGSSQGGGTSTSTAGSTGSSFATAEDFARALSQSFGQAQSESQSTGSSKSSAFSIGAGT